MNFPLAQKTGRLGELAVEEIFTSWSWTVGKDFIDAGYDLSVQPDVNQFCGDRFLVQVKATTVHSKSGGIIAAVGKDRVRQYIRSRIPVFIVRVTADKKLYWIHVQEWAKHHPNHPKGPGNCNIKFPSSQILSDQQAFTEYLIEVFKSEAEKISSLPKLVEERSNYLSAIDSRLKVVVGINDGVQHFEISAKSEPVKLNLEIQTKNNSTVNQSLQNAVRFGLPVNIEVDALSIKGTELTKELGLDSAVGGKLSIRSGHEKKGFVNLCPGINYVMAGTPLALPVILSLGNEGAAVRMENPLAILKFSILIESKGKASLSLGVEVDQIHRDKLKNLYELRALGDWAYEVLQQNAMCVEMNFQGHSGKSLPTDDGFDAIKPVLKYLTWLGRLHKVAVALNSDFILERNYSLSESDLDTISFAHWLLKGERRNIKLDTFEVDDIDQPLSLVLSAPLRMSTELEFAIGSQILGRVPVVADLKNYECEALSKAGSYRFFKGKAGKSLMRLGDLS